MPVKKTQLIWSIRLNVYYVFTLKLLPQLGVYSRYNAALKKKNFVTRGCVHSILDLPQNPTWNHREANQTHLYPSAM